MPRPQLECVGGPHCGKRLYAPELGTATLRVPADPNLTADQVLLLTPLELPATYRAGLYRVRLHRCGDLVLSWDGEL